MKKIKKIREKTPKQTCKENEVSQSALFRTLIDLLMTKGTPVLCSIERYSPSDFLQP